MTKKATIELQFDPMDYTGMLTLTNDLYAFKAYRVDRGRFCNYKNELSFSGVYILDAGFSEGGDDKGDDTTHDELSNPERSQINDGQVARRQIYIGQSSNVFDRLRAHNNKPPKEMEWTTAICFLKPELKNATLLRLEKMLFHRFKILEREGRFDVKTDVVSKDEVELDDRLLNARNEIFA